MSCAVVVSGSPVYSPKTLTLKNEGSPSPSSPFRFRFHKQQISCSIRNRDESSSSPTLLKRKRPARIDIPLDPFSFAMPASDGQDDVEVESVRFSVFCKRGRRESMEDRHKAVLDLQGDSKQAFFGVFDGHGGARAAEFAANNIHKNIMNEVMSREEDATEEAVKNGYLVTDSDFLKEGEKARGGTCCATALIRNGELVVSNAGDCRAVMSRGGIAEALTSDHRPSREDERERIESLGGYVNSFHGVCRLQGSLAVSRGIGDLHLKQWVTAEPETKILKIEPECEFLILASDGLWDKVSNQEAVDMARPLCIDAAAKTSPLSACKNLVELSVKRGSSDDISVMIVQLGHFT
eukprot:TRINITY_DN4816_c0_g1_i1.p1 TRINITY_DN4816_c0_g1~~TRINITY_DN4816_c0_g1_i1.p1  ORF type:complete len:393 (-),score=51.17 TRINITY_DN4816_c0_g1_i1:284-1336(-)